LQKQGVKRFNQYRAHLCHASSVFFPSSPKPRPYGPPARRGKTNWGKYFARIVPWLEVNIRHLQSRPGAVIDFHALRGTFLTALASKVSASTLGALGRHASVQTTEKHYVNHRLASLGESLDDANLFWFSNGSPDKRKTKKYEETKVNRAAALFSRFVTTLKPLELQGFTAKIRQIIGD
jgi:integrase